VGPHPCTVSTVRGEGSQVTPRFMHQCRPQRDKAQRRGRTISGPGRTTEHPGCIKDSPGFRGRCDAIMVPYVSTTGSHFFLHPKSCTVSIDMFYPLHSEVTREIHNPLVPGSSPGRPTSSHAIHIAMAFKPGDWSPLTKSIVPPPGIMSPPWSSLLMNNQAARCKKFESFPAADLTHTSR
jgi:hypothetical protein